MFAGSSFGGDAHRSLLDGSTGVVSTCLVAVAVLMMLWTWTDNAAFAAAGGGVIAALLTAAFVRVRRRGTELVGGPLDGARVRLAATPCPPGECLVLDAPGGVRALYGPDGAGRMVYQGPAEAGR